MQATSAATSKSTVTLINEWIDVIQKERGLSSLSLMFYRGDLLSFRKRLLARESDFLSATKEVILRIVEFQLECGLKTRTIARQNGTCRQFYAYLLKKGVLLENPMPKIPLPRPEMAKRDMLTTEEVQHLLAAPDTSTSKGFRDRTILELLCCTGIRVSELTSLLVDQFDSTSWTIRVSGRDGSCRTVPLEGDSSDWLWEFIHKHRPILLGERVSAYVFPTDKSVRLPRQALWHIVQRYAKKARLTKRLSPEGVRLIFVARLLDRGDSLRFIQARLGHTDITTTHAMTQRAHFHIPPSEKTKMLNGLIHRMKRT